MVKDTNFGTHTDTKIRPMAIVTKGELAKGMKVEGHVFSTQPNGFAKIRVTADDVRNFVMPKEGIAFITKAVFAAKFYAEIKDAVLFKNEKF